MTEVRLGVTLPQFTDDPDLFWAAARRAEEAGLDSLWLFDHLWPLSGGKERPIVEAWTALAWLAARTNKVRIGTLVTRSTLRHPAVLAKMAATVAHVAPGRVVVGVGSGDTLSKEENESFGVPYFGGDDRVPQLRAAVEVLSRYVTQEEVSYADEFTAVRALPTSPRAVPRPALWLGGRTKSILELAGRKCDGWNGWGGGPKRFGQDAAVVLGAAGNRDVELSWGGLVVLGAGDEEARRKLGRRDPAQYVVGGPATVAAHLARLVDAGARHLILTFPDAARPGVYERLAEEVKQRIGL